VHDVEYIVKFRFKFLKNSFSVVQAGLLIVT
jgi:hypothetical protein